MALTTLYATTGDDVVLLRETTRAWTVEPLLRGVGAQCLAVDPGDGHHLAVGTFDEGVFLSEDGGRSWRRAERLPATRVLSVAISPAWRVAGHGALFAGCEPSALYWSEDGGRHWHEASALRQLPSAPTWSFPPRPWTSHVRAIALSPHDPGLVLVGIELGGILRSTDGGMTWADQRPGCYLDCHALLLHPAMPELVFEAAGGGVARSEDAGDTWHTVNEGLDCRYVWAVASPPDDPTTWFVSAAPGPREAHGPGPHRGAMPNREGTAQARIYRRQGTNPWEPIAGYPDPLPSMPYALVVPMSEPQVVYAGFRNGSLWRGIELGHTWQELPVRVDSILTLVVPPA